MKKLLSVLLAATTVVSLGGGQLSTLTGQIMTSAICRSTMTMARISVAIMVLVTMIPLPLTRKAM